MRKVLFIAFIGLLFSSCDNDGSKVQMGKKTTMTVNAVYDAGRVAKGEMIHAKFKVENTGDYALVLSDVKGSCSCTVADWSKDPIAPGETGFIKAKVNTENFSTGPMKRSIRILSNTTPEQTVVTVQATIIQ